MKIEIKEPCHENWNNMTPTDQGKFCNSCEKEVVDFTQMSKTDIQTYFKSSCHDNICGRFEKTQLYAKPTLFSKIKYAAVLVLGVFLPTSCNKTTKGEPSVDASSVNNDTIKVEVSDTTKNKDFLMGEIAPEGQHEKDEKIMGAPTTVEMDSLHHIVSGKVAVPVKEK